MVGDVKATGQGGSKKQAKHAAAEAVLKTLTAGLVSEDALPFEEKPEYLYSLCLEKETGQRAVNKNFSLFQLEVNHHFW